MMYELMQVVRNLDQIKSLNGCVATIGNFDGVHLGHQSLLSQTADYAKKLGVPSVAVTFEPQPAEYFRATQAPARLTRLREKFMAIRQYAPVDYLLCLRFNPQLAELSAADFIQKILIEKLALRCLVTGDDFRFGCQRQGDITWLLRASQEYGYEVQQNSSLAVAGQRISSTQIRHYLAQGDLASAKLMLGRNYWMMGQVVKGDQRGRQLGFPTANIFLKRRVSPLAGVYAVKVQGIGDSFIYGVANVGTRPTVDGTRSLLEVYLLDFNQDIYGYQLSVEFIAKLRDEQKFSSLEALKQQISQDVVMAKQLLKV